MPVSCSSEYTAACTKCYHTYKFIIIQFKDPSCVRALGVLGCEYSVAYACNAPWYMDRRKCASEYIEH